MEEEYAALQEKAFQKALSKAIPVKNRKKLLPHEQERLEKGDLQNITHHGASSIWLEAPSTVPKQGFTNVYRPMGDLEVLYLVENNFLPDTQPYQAIIEGSVGRNYANKYLTGQKWTDTNPTTVVEFTVPVDVIETLKKIQIKAEDGALSMGLGHKAGGGLHIFNDSMKKGDTTWRIVKVKRNL
jgi:hypothetical protein